MKSATRGYPELQGFFQFPDFNHIQKDCLPKIMSGQDNLVLSAPTSSGKTVLFEMAILKYCHLPSPYCLYLAPIKSLCHQKYNEWSFKFRSKLTIAEMTGDVIQTNNDKFLQSHITIGTPEKIDYLSRQSLEYLKKIRLLLIDEIHMLNFQERGATLQAIVSRIMSLNNKVRIIAVSATIPNIYEVAEWLKVPNQMICVYGAQYRPVPLKKVVLGFKSTGNSFTFEGSLNYRLLQVIRSYSEQKGSLVFCPTQKGTEAACRLIISQMKQREFIENDKQLVALIQAAKQVLNSNLQIMIPQGIAFHNASLSLQDRSIVERLFLELKIKVLCTTSTLSMGINLPARLVIIKSTQCYRGSMKGYQEYTKIQTDQMMGRAGRPPFDNQGTVVIMTEKSNYHRYNSDLELQNLESQLFGHLLEHLNAEISLGSITSLLDVHQYLFNSFCYIRMKKSPIAYGITGDVKQFVIKQCRKAVQTLAELKIINFYDDTQRVSPRPLSNSISRSAVEVKSIVTISTAARQIVSQRQYLFALCKCEQICRYTSKVEQRKLLKGLNEANKFVLKEAISTCERKSFVLIQTELSNRHIQFWELRRQAVQIIQLVRRLNYCVKTLGLEIKSFWLYYWSVRYQKYLTEKFWELAEGRVLIQLTGLQDKGKMLAFRGIRTVNDLKKNIENIGTWLQKGDGFINTIINELKIYQQGLIFLLKKDQFSQVVNLIITFTSAFNNKLRGITICIGDAQNNLYFHKYLNQKNVQVVITFPKLTKLEYKIGIIKDGIIGFDQFYLLQNENITKFNLEQIQLKPAVGRKTVSALKLNRDASLSPYEKKSKSHEMAPKQKKQKLKDINQKPKRQVSKNGSQSFSNTNQSNKNQFELKSVIRVQKISKQLKLPPSYKIRLPINRQPLEQQQFLEKKIKKDNFRYKPLNEYKWKPGFEEISSQSDKETLKSLKIVDRQSKDKVHVFGKKSKDAQPSQKRVTVSKKRDKFEFEEFTYQNEETVNKKKTCQPEQDDVFSYFYNMF